MCGILFGLNLEEPSSFDNLARRGPDDCRTVSIDVEDNKLVLYSSVLHLRGRSLVIQPVITDRFILQWNGEIFGGPFQELSTKSDTLILTEHLQKCGNGRDIETLFASIRGPFAFVLADLKDKIVYYGRDIFGRRSLLCSSSQSSLKIASAGYSFDFTEVPAVGIYKRYLARPDKYSITLWSELNISIPRISPLESSSRSHITLAGDFLQSLAYAIQRRLVNIHYNIAILFSGGADSLMLAAMTCKVAHHELTVHCINVAFSLDGEGFELVPDRVTGRRAFQELQCLYPSRRLQFVAVDINKAQFDDKREHVKRIMFPCDSVMDESIAMALWFAASVTRSTSSKVLFVGMGADEQLAGYQRHMSRLKRGNYKDMLEELQLDLDRISLRNMGRDDRVIGDHGVEARYPFLDEDFVLFVSQAVPLSLKAQVDVGNKLILRKALATLGFSEPICNSPKRAIQFGARTAKLQSCGPNASLTQGQAR